MKQQVDYVIALTHMRIPNDERLAREVPEVSFRPSILNLRVNQI